MILLSKARKRRLHFGRCSINKKELALRLRTAKLKQITDSLDTAKTQVAADETLLKEAEERATRIHADITATLLRAMGVVTGDHLPPKEGGE